MVNVGGSGTNPTGSADSGAPHRLRRSLPTTTWGIGGGVCSDVSTASSTSGSGEGKEDLPSSRMTNDAGDLKLPNQ